MTESEAVEKLKNMRLFMQIEDENNDCKFTEDDYKANEIAIQALEEVQKYREIGSMEEFRADREKQMPKKPKERDCIGFDTLACPECKMALYLYEPYCDNCGQKIDWSDDNDD